MNYTNFTLQIHPNLDHIYTGRPVMMSCTIGTDGIVPVVGEIDGRIVDLKVVEMIWEAVLDSGMIVDIQRQWRNDGNLE